MGYISSINFEKSIAINCEHNDRTLAPSYLIDTEKGAECNRTAESARALKNQIIAQAKENYTQNTGQKFQAKSYEWSAVCNIKPETTMQDLEKLAEHFEKKYGFQCYQIAIHRDEGHENEQGEIVPNLHAHLEFITLDRETGKQNFKMRDFTKQVMREIQTETAEILQMQRGQDKRLSGAKRIKPREYARQKEAEKEQTAPLKKKIKELETENEVLNQELESEKLTKKQNLELIEQLRKDSKGKGFDKDYFKELNEAKKNLTFENQEQFNEWKTELIKRHTKKRLFGDKTDTEAVLTEQFEKIEQLNDIIQATEQSKEQEIKAEKERLKKENEKVLADLQTQELERLNAEYEAKEKKLKADYEKSKENAKSFYAEKYKNEKAEFLETQRSKENALISKELTLNKRENDLNEREQELNQDSFIKSLKEKIEFERKAKERAEAELQRLKNLFGKAWKYLKSKISTLTSNLKAEKEKNDKLQALNTQNASNAKETPKTTKEFTHYKKENGKITLLTAEQALKEQKNYSVMDILTTDNYIMPINQASGMDKEMINIKLEASKVANKLFKPKTIRTKQGIKTRTDDGITR